MKKNISVKVQMEGHHSEIVIPAHRYESVKYPSLKLCFHREIESISNDGDIKLSKRLWVLSDIETGLRLFKPSVTMIDLELQLFDLINEKGLENVEQTIQAAKKRIDDKSLESVLWSQLYKYGITLTQTEIFDFIEELKSNGVEMIYYDLEEKESS